MEIPYRSTHPSVKVDNGIYSVSIDVKNVGKFAGKEVVQLYVSAPNRFQMNKPEKELKAFTKTKELRPGETVTATLKLNTTDLASYDEASSSWVVDAGNYKFLIGTSSKDIKAGLPSAASAWRTDFHQTAHVGRGAHSLC